MKMTRLLSLICLSTLLAAGPALAQAGSDRVAALKANLAQSKAVLRHYQWIETTVVSMNGEEKSTKEQRCYYGDDGALQKIEIGDTSDAQESRGGPLRRRIAAKKKAELTGYMQDAVALVKTYVPPSASKIQAAKDAGTFSLEMIEPGKRARITFTNYEKPGDHYAIDLDLADNRPLGLKVSTYLNGPGNAIQLNVTMARLNNGASYASVTTLNAPSKGLTVTVRNSGYQKVN